jgi:hypothetical protein
VLDPLAALLLFVHPRLGVPVTAALIASNVVHNLVTTARSMPGRGALAVATSSPELMSQIAFLIFVAATARFAWADLPHRRNAQEP